MVLTVSFVLSSVTGLFCHRRQRISGLSAPGRADTPSAKLDASVGASGPHDFAVRKQSSLVRVLLIAHEFKEPALRSHRAQNAAASTASRPASVTIASRPSVGRDGEGSRDDLGGAGSGIFLQRGLDCPNQLEKSRQIDLWAHGLVARVRLISASRREPLPRLKVAEVHNRENLRK
jgi:hypothetical protein